jgi:hypothetical protein
MTLRGATPDGVIVSAVEVKRGNVEDPVIASPESPPEEDRKVGLPPPGSWDWETLRQFLSRDDVRALKPIAVYRLRLQDRIIDSMRFVSKLRDLFHKRLAVGMDER